jgi:hypothetical protein
MNLIARSLLTEDEIMRIERPYALVMLAGHYPAIMRLPDLSLWKFNLALGLGDQEHNRKLREIRESEREARKPAPIELWGIWDKYSRKKKPGSNFEEQGGIEMVQDGEVISEDGVTLRIPARVYPGAVSMTEAARAGRQIDEMFTQFKQANRLRSKKEIERIEAL